VSTSARNDESFREIQLNGKQLVFLFMAATVVSVVIFLCGVLVGRGVRPDRSAAAEAATAEIAADRSAVAAEPSAAASTTTPGSAIPPAPVDELSYPDRLQRSTPPSETLKQPEPTRESAAHHAPPSIPPPPASAAIVATPLAKASAITASDPSGPGYAVQVMIFDTSREADGLARQLIAKGYPAYVLDPGKGTARPIYRVRVGKYKNRQDAEEISSRLETGEQFKPWIAR
jgi:cell division protein FtsN